MPDTALQPTSSPLLRGVKDVAARGRYPAEMSAEPMPFNCEHVVDSGLGRRMAMEK